MSWELYDSGYTERYIGLPLSNPDVYKAGSVLTYIESLPDEYVFFFFFVFLLTLRLFCGIK